ncbi:hypothetical protein [uncultured Devosia sp.]|uniref:hypothetical protein n=1 Tax=uncultured Devosia sp. TaxID=211434 RepID=UPI0035CA4BBB
MSLSHLSIAGRIYCAFAALIALLAMLVVVAWLGVQTLSGTFSFYRGVAAQADEIGVLVDQLGRTRLAFSRYQVTPTAEAGAGVVARLADLSTANAAVSGLTPLGEQLADYSAQVGQMIALDQDVLTQTTQMQQSGDAATAQLASMIANASQSANLNAKAAAISGLAMQQLLQTRLAAGQLAATDAGQFAAAQDLAQQTLATLTELRSIFFKTEDVAQVDGVAAQVAPFAQTMVGVHQSLTQRQSLGQTVAAIDAELAAAYDGQLADARQAQQTLGAAGEAQSGRPA